MQPPISSVETLIDLFKSGQWRTKNLTLANAALAVVAYAASILLKDGVEEPLQLTAEAPRNADGAFIPEIVTASEFVDRAEKLVCDSKAVPDGAESLTLPVGWQTIAIFLIQQVLNKLAKRGS